MSAEQFIAKLIALVPPPGERSSVLLGRGHGPRNRAPRFSCDFFWPADAIDLARLGRVGDYETCVAEMVSFLRFVAASLLQDDEALEEIEIAKALK